MNEDAIYDDHGNYVGRAVEQTNAAGQREKLIYNTKGEVVRRISDDGTIWDNELHVVGRVVERDTQAVKDAWAYLAADEDRYEGFRRASATVHEQAVRARRDAAQKRIPLKILAAAICFVSGLAVGFLWGRTDHLALVSLFLIASPWVIVGLVAENPELDFVEEIQVGIILGAVVFGIGFGIAH